MTRALVCTADNTHSLEDVILNKGDRQVLAASIFNGMLEDRFRRVKSSRLFSFNVAELPESDEDVRNYTNQLSTLGNSKELLQEIVDYRHMFSRFYTCLPFVVENAQMIPYRNLADFFVAAPVWYFVNRNDAKGYELVFDHRMVTKREIRYKEIQDLNHWRKRVQAFCEQYPTSQMWYDLFQIFNTRGRTLSEYDGDIIPADVFLILEKARELFDTVVIATSYHDVALKEWREGVTAPRNWDPFLLGFIDGCPMFFVLARFSESEIFLGYQSMVENTISFLKKHKRILAGFNGLDLIRFGEKLCSTWHFAKGEAEAVEWKTELTCYYPTNEKVEFWQYGNLPKNPRTLGDRLIRQVNMLVARHSTGELIPYLRNE